MQQIQKLDLVGFKSFCDRTELIFDEGTTAIVGPNGCGKSNIADAISWVVGEQSAKILRTDRMEGVIFNGTQTRKATSMAQVILTLRLPESLQVPEGLELSPEGFTVGRVLYRSGESEYQLDGRRCRLRDIQALFEGTGLGPNSYALIEQGRIGQILSSKPADRRSLIEEAARITLFKARRYSAETKLELAQHNLLRVNDIIRELERQLESLKRQAAKARRYGRLREEMRGLHKLKLAMEQRQLQQKLGLCSERLRSAQEQEQALLAELARLDQARVLRREACLQQEELLNRERENLASLKLDVERASSLRQRQENQKTELGRRLQDIHRARNADEGRAHGIAKERKGLELALRHLIEEIEREQKVVEQEQERSELLVVSIEQTEGRMEELRSSLLNGAGRLSDLRNLQWRCQENSQRIEARSGRLLEERASGLQERANLLSQLSGLKEQGETNALGQRAMAAAHEEAERRAAALAQSVEQVSNEIVEIQEEHSLMQHRYSSLEEVERRRSNYSEGVQKFLSTHLPGEEFAPAHTLADYVETDPRYEAAIESYLDDPLQYILVEGLEEAVHNVERLKQIGAGKCTFLALRDGRTNGRSVPRPGLSGDGIIGYLDDLLRMQEDVRHAFERALPEFASTVMVTDLPTAFRAAETAEGISFLTLGGESYSPRGTLSAVGERKAMAGFLALKREKRELEVRLEALRGKIHVARERLARLKEEQSGIEESLKTSSAEMRRLEMEAVGLHHFIGRLESEIQKLDQTENVTSAELSQLLAEKQDLELKMKEAAADIEEIEVASRSGEQELRDLGLQLDSLKADTLALSKQLASLSVAQAARQERKSSSESELNRLLRDESEVQARIGAMEHESESILALSEVLEREQRDAEERLAGLARDLQLAEIAVSEKQQQLSGERQALAAIEESVGQLHGEREAAMESRSRIEIEKTRLDNDLDHLSRLCEVEYHVPLSDVISQIPEGDWQRDYDAVCQQHDQFRDRLDHFGAVNMRALEEYQELEERYQFQGKQRADIEKSIADTQKAIAEINRRSIEQFQEAFTRIRENFIDVFQMLFKGGQSDLRLLDEGDVLESGIDIIAQPPGKRLQSVLLLSGGEKALTALALLIAIFHYRPSPFCVLDEVDAPLDDANVLRFTQLITELSKDTQFILITHNKKTMQIANTLYGVTMEEPGVSKVVSVDFRAL